MNKTVLMTATIASLTVNVFAADNNFIGGTNNTVTNNAKSVGVVGYQNTVGGNNAVAFGENNIAAGTNSFAGGNDSKALGRDSFALGNNAVADVQNSVALGTNATTGEVVTTDHIFINGERYDFAGVADSTVSIGATNKAGNSGVTDYKRTITNVAAGRVDGTSTDAINGSQLNAVINALKFTTVADGANTTVNRTQNIDGGKELTNMNSVQLGTINDPQRNYIGRNGSHVFNGEVNSNYGSNGFKVENTDNLDNAQFNMDGMVADSNGKHIEFTTQNINAGHQQVHNVADGVADTDAVNMRQLKAQSQSGLNEINTTNQRLNKLGASSAALAGLHPLDFNKDDKASYAISYGHYRSSNAVALGAFYRPNERTLFGIGMSLGAEKQFTANVAFKVGKGSDYVQEAKDAQSRISKLEALVNQLVEEVERSKQSK